MIEKAMTCKECGKPYSSFDGTQKDVCTCPVESIDKLTGSKIPTDKEIEDEANKRFSQGVLRAAFTIGAEWAITKIITNNA